MDKKNNLYYSIALVFTAILMTKDDKNNKKKDNPFDDDFDPFNFDFENFNFNEFMENFMPFFTGSSFGKMIDEMVKNLLNSIKDEMNSPDALKDLINNPFVYGFQIGLGPDGKPSFRQFGNVKPKGTGDVETYNVREPLVDVFKEKEKVRVIAEVPGISKGDIKLSGTENYLNIKAHSKDRKYEKRIDLPVPVKIKTAKARYNNGVLEVVIDRKQIDDDGEGISIDVQ